MEETTASASVPEADNEEGVQIKGKDFVFLNAPKIYFPGDAPLENTDKRELYSILDELFQGGGGGGEDDWSPPDWWIPVPEPRENEVLILVDIADDPSSYHSSGWGYMHDGTNNYYGTYTIDYGNGVVSTVEDGSSAPSDVNAPYSAKGQYIISMTSEDRLFYRPVDNKRNSVLIVKCGANISCKNSGIAYGYNLYNLYRMQYIQFGGEPYIGNGFLSSAKCIKKVKYLNSPTEIPEYSFNNLSTLEYLEGVDGVASIGQYAFSGCSSLLKIRTLSEDCTFGRDTFTGCYSMQYPRPDGSTN